MLFVYPAQRVLFVYPVQWMLFVGSAYISGVPPPEAVEVGASFRSWGLSRSRKPEPCYLSVAYQIEKFVSGPFVFQEDA